MNLMVQENVRRGLVEIILIRKLMHSLSQKKKKKSVKHCTLQFFFNAEGVHRAVCRL
jgi:hypothetical protein